MKPFISLTSDFGVQTQGVGIMEAVALHINPNAHVIHLMHGLPDFDITAGARTMEGVCFLPVGYHICVVDPGVGTKRKAIALKTKRGDYLIGPDNGVLLSAARLLGGITQAVEITNEKYMCKPVSPIFHGRDIFTPAAAHLSLDVGIQELGRNIRSETLAKAPYGEALCKDGRIEAQIISINKFGSFHLNILQSEFDKLKLSKNNKVKLTLNGRTIQVPYVTTFGEVPKAQEMIMKDDYMRIEVAVNQGSFVKKYKITLGDKCTVEK
jgi:S-adenosyl-L-methionine hydrolase (adenosine-forming)